MRLLNKDLLEAVIRINNSFKKRKLPNQTNFLVIIEIDYTNEQHWMHICISIGMWYFEFC